MEEPKKLIYDSGEATREYSYGSAAAWTETACMSGISPDEYGYPELFSDLTVNLHHAR